MEIKENALKDKILGDIKNHVVQVESLVLSVILFTAILSLKSIIETIISPELAFLFPFVFLAIVPIFVRVTNPESKLRSILTWGLSGAGVGGTIGGGLAGSITGGLGAPAGALIGAPIGFIIGSIIGPIVDKTPEVLTQGQAREFLGKMIKKYPSLNMKIIVNATELHPADENCCVYMFESDGIIKCTKKDAMLWLENECWKKLR